MPDLNAVSLETSPAFTLAKERLSGTDFAAYLELVADDYNLPIYENVTVNNVEKDQQHYIVETTIGAFKATYIIFAVGEFSTPNKEIEGSLTHGIHYGDVSSWQDFSADEYTIIGGNESSLDAAIQLTKLGKNVTIYTTKSGLLEENADPSLSLSPYTRQRFLELNEQLGNTGKINVLTDHDIVEIRPQDEGYNLLTTAGELLFSATKPILATGFLNSVRQFKEPLFTYDQEGDSQLNTVDESTINDNLFLIGPKVRQEEAILCYIYKFRQRFALIAEEISKRMSQEISEDYLEKMKVQSFYLADCSNCVVDCRC